MRTLLPAVFSALLVSLAASAARIQVEGSVGAAIEQSAPGDTVAIPAGTFELDEALAPASNTRIVGAGQGKTILRFTGESPSVFFRLGGVENVELAEMTLDGAENPNATQGISGSNARDLNVHHITVRNLVKGPGFGPHGILFSGKNPSRKGGVTNSVVSDCRFENIGVDAKFGGAIRLSWGSSHNRILRNVIEDTGRGGIFADNGSTDAVVRFNTVKGSGGEGLGIEVWGGCDRAVIEDNTIDHWLSVGGCSYCAVRRNTIGDRSGVYKFCGIEGIGSQLVVTGNTVDGGAKIGLSLSSPHAKNYGYWARNIVRECNQWGAQFQGDEGGIAYHYLYRCTFENMPIGAGPVKYPGDEGHGFRILGNCRHITFEECVFRDNGRFGLQLLGPNVDSLFFSGCSITGNKGRAVTGPSGYNALEFANCEVSDNGSNALPEEKPFETQPPEATLKAPSEAAVGETVILLNASTASGPALSAALWDLGKDIPVFHDIAAAEKDADGPPPRSVVTSFEAPGVYRAALVVWDAAGRAARAETTITITE
jgi:hypothetical protein